MIKTLKTTFLACQNPAKNTDKVYNVHIVVQSKDSYGVQKESGRRGSTLINQGTKWFPTRTKAESEARKVINSKIKKGYRVKGELDCTKTKFTEEYVSKLIRNAAVVCAEGHMDGGQYQKLKNMLNSGDEETQELAEKIIHAKTGKLKGSIVQLKVA